MSFMKMLGEGDTKSISVLMCFGKAAEVELKKQKQQNLNRKK